MAPLVLLLACAVAFSVAVPIEVRKDNIEERGDLFEGDIVLTPGIQAGIINETYRWPNKTVIYDLDPEFDNDEVRIILEAIRELSNKTCLKFYYRSNEADYVHVIKGGADSGCWSYVGKQGGSQDLNLQSPGCVRKGTVAHEFIHAIGFYHEQSRPDRDQYVTINWSNILPGKEHNFDVHTAQEVSPYNVTYDYGSVMHYSAYGFALNTSIPTIIPLDSTATIGQRLGLSDKDAKKLNNMYNCEL